MVRETGSTLVRGFLTNGKTVSINTLDTAIKSASATESHLQRVWTGEYVGDWEEDELFTDSTRQFDADVKTIEALTLLFSNEKEKAIAKLEDIDYGADQTIDFDLLTNGFERFFWCGLDS